MEIGKPAAFYPLRIIGGFIYVPYEKTDLDLVFKGNQNDMDKIIEYWHLIKSPKYYLTKSLQENLQAMYDDLQYWPKPMLANKVIKALHLEYENENR
jgi:hypothetical protein